MRRGLGRGRTLIAIGAIVAIVGMVLPWIKVGGVVLSARTEWGFDTPGVLVFLAAVGMLALLVLPYTTRSGRASLDRATSYLVLALVALAGLVLAFFDLLGTEGGALGPAEVSGIWLSTLGVIVVVWGVLELFAERSAVS